MANVPRIKAESVRSGVRQFLGAGFKLVGKPIESSGERTSRGAVSFKITCYITLSWDPSCSVSLVRNLCISDSSSFSLIGVPLAFKLMNRVIMLYQPKNQCFAKTLSGLTTHSAITP
jgi:hypothetical protein